MHVMKQGKRYLESLFRDKGISPRRGFGQSFLVDGNLLEFIVKQADPKPCDLVFEVGAGTGQLTELLAVDAGAVLSVEIDKALFDAARERLVQFRNVEIIHADALKGKWNMNPVVMRAMEAARRSCGRLKLVSNLPYAVAMPVIQNLLESGLPWETMVVTVQKEFADRMTDPPGGKSYGGFSVVFQALATAEILRVLKPSVFWPKPGVDSAIVKITPADGPPEGVDFPLFKELVKRSFQSRRKKISNALDAWLAARGICAMDLLIEAGIDPFLRAEHLGFDQYAALCKAIQGRRP